MIFKKTLRNLRNLFKKMELRERIRKLKKKKISNELKANPRGITEVPLDLIEQLITKLATVEEGATRNDINETYNRLKNFGIDADSLDGMKAEDFSLVKHGHHEFKGYLTTDEYNKFKSALDKDTAKLANNLIDLFRDIEEIKSDDSIGKEIEKINKKSVSILNKLQRIKHNALINLEWSKSGHIIDIDFDLSGNKLTNVGTPKLGTDGVNKSYVDAIVQRNSRSTLGGAGILAGGTTGQVLKKKSNNDYDVEWGAGGGGTGGHTIQDEGVALTARTNLNFVGAGVTVTDDAGNDATKVTINAGGGTGDVIGPATNTDNYIPQWNGADSKTLKNGLAVPAGGLAGLTALGGKQDTLTFGIADTNKVQINSADVADNDYAKFTATGLEGRSYSEVLSDIGAEPAKGADDNYVTDAEKIVIGNTSGTNTGDNAVNSNYSGLTQYTDELAQDAVGGMIATTNSVTLTYTDATPELKADVKKQMSIDSDASGLKLSGDSASPGNSKLYGTNSGGTKGWYDQPSGGGGYLVTTVTDETASPTDTSGHRVILGNLTGSSDGLNLVGCWNMDETAEYDGTTGEVVDSSSAAHHGTATGYPDKVDSGKIGKSRSLVAANGDYITIPSHADFGGLTAWTIAAWIKTTDTTATRTIARRADCFDFAYGWGGTDKLRIWLHSGSGWEYAGDSHITTTNDGAWHWVVARYDGTYLKLYIDNTEEATSALPSRTMSTSTNPMYIGAGNQRWNGELDQVCFWQRALTTGEMTSIYNSGSGRAIDTAAQTVTVNLPTAVSNTAMFTVKNISLLPVIIDPHGTQTVDGSSTKTITTQNESLTLISDNANWQVVSKYTP